MTRRVRCRYCGSLFDRDRIDDHVERCKYRVMRNQTVNGGGRTIIIDGNNVAHCLTQDGIPRLSNISMAREGLMLAGFTPIVVISAALVHRIDHAEALMKMVDSGEIICVRRGLDDDLEIIRLAERLNGLVLSNDRFLTYLEEYPWLKKRLIRYRMTPTGILIDTAV
ncbi:MAG: hypothetical protein QXS20_08040 [Candidatus Thorarchaeota archaeon]